MQPDFDPLWDSLDGLEDSIAWDPGPSPGLGPDPDDFMDPTAQLLGMLEASIEQTTAPPAFEPEPLVPEPAPDLGPHLAELPGPTSPPPPVPDESRASQTPGIKTPAAARPFFTTDGLSSASYRPRFGHGGAGIRNPAVLSSDYGAGETRECPLEGDTVEIEQCRDCPWFDPDSGDCLYGEDEEEPE